ncbi:DUF5679 domain-containing protein [Chloroflexota bacterium]
MDNRKLPKIKMPHRVIVKAPGLLHMRYKVKELSAELDIPPTTLRGWLDAGAPNERDNRKHIWIIGIEFARWVEQFKKPKRKKKLTDHQAYCFKCRQAVDLLDPVVIPQQGKLIRITGECPVCGTTINRGGRNAGTA